VIATVDIHTAFAHCEQITRRHYENFPVASLLIPRERRRFLYAIYAFARIADDFADEGSLPAEERLSLLDDWEEKLNRCFDGSADDPVFIALAETVSRTGIPRQLLADLLSAFRMDVTTNRFQTFDDLLGYCRCSANPVGRLVLRVFGYATPDNDILSDCICTGLQLANFWQDVVPDWHKGRVYIPLEDFDRFGYTEERLGQKAADPLFRAMIKHEVNRTRRLFEEGRTLVENVGSDLRCELALTLRGGMGILRKIESNGYDVLTRRPVLTGFDKLALLMKTVARRAQ
jgi:squalene synthase HpnC